MKFSFFMTLAVFIALSSLASAETPKCAKALPSEPFVLASDFKWNMTLAEIKDRYDVIYPSGKRLKGRAYFDENLQAYAFESNQGPIKIDPTFIKSITRHVEIALERRYADQLIFPDMGHSHFHIPQTDWDQNIGPIASDRRQVYERMMALRSMKILYHTAEQLEVRPGQHSQGPLPQDPELLWRYFSRNIIGNNKGGEDLAPQFAFGERYNTVRDLPGHRAWSAGFNISASKDGCFAFQKNGQTYYFDLSLEDLPYAP